MTSLTGLWKERRREVTALALSGGGSRADFQLGALRYLYDRVGITPQVITGTSAGSILAATLAQSADHDEQRRYLRELETRWAQMRDSSDMFTPHPWFDRLRRRGPEWMAALQKRQHRQSPLGRTFARAATAPRAGVDGTAGSRATSGPFARGGPLDPAAVAERLRTMTAGRPWPPPREDHGETGGTIGVVEFLTALREVGRARPDLELILRGAEREKAMYRPGPLVERLVDPEVFAAERVGRSGVTLRIAVVGLESGELRYVTESGGLVDRLNRPVEGEPVDLVEAVRASCAIPAVFRPVQLRDETYVDGGVRETLPAEVAMDHLDVTTCYAVVASPPGVPHESSYADKDLISVVLRSTAGIMADEGLRDEVERARRDGAVLIAPEMDLHDILTVDPGLTAIAMDYGYLRAAEAVHGATASQARLTRDVVTLRREIWQLEQDLLAPPATVGGVDPATAEPPAPATASPAPGVAPDPRDGPGDRGPSPGAAGASGTGSSPGAWPAADGAAPPDFSELATMKRRLRSLVVRIPADRLPPGADEWWRTFERHAFEIPYRPTWV
ncbi:patatin-like phospholipase family protein [Georgenia deserti]|uniref:Patatin-like phospholipase family protein n=1 Tax=Georgenia deserti TaxID=2093781 RepID=A0ABW4L5W2_9MICO